MIDDDLVQFVSFRLGTQEFAVEILQLRRVLPFTTPEPLRGAPPWVAGTLAFEGTQLVVVDLRERLGLPTGTGADTRVLVLDLAGGPLGLVVDAARRVERADPADVAAPPEVEGFAPGQVLGLLERPGHALVILNATRLLAPADRAALAALLEVPA